MQTKLENLPESTNKQFWGDGVQSKTEVVTPQHKHFLKQNGIHLQCDCGWGLKISHPDTAQRIMTRINQ
jgi:hypothetical protein